MSEYIRVTHGRLAEHVCGVPAEGMVAVPDGFRGVVGMDAREFDGDWNVRPLSSRVEEGLVEVKPEFVLDGEDIRPKTLGELVDTGLFTVDELHTFDGKGLREKTVNELYRDHIKPVPEGYRLVESAQAVDGLLLEEMSMDEKIAAGIITQATADSIQAFVMRAERNARFQPYDEAIARLNRNKRKAPTAAIEQEIAEWDVYAELLADVPEQAGFPWVIEWPIRPDGVQI